MARLKALVGRRVREIRDQRNLTQQELADKVGLSLNMIGYIERGIKFPSAGTFEKLSRVLGVGADEFLRTDPKDRATDDRREALYALEGLLSDDPPEYILMIGRVVREMKKGGK